MEINNTPTGIQKIKAVLMYKQTIETCAKAWREAHRKMFKRMENPLYEERMKDEILLVAKHMAKVRNITLLQASQAIRKCDTLEEAIRRVESLISED